MENRPVSSSGSTSSTPRSTPRSKHRLVLMRHAKAEAWGNDDHDRRLTDGGRADADAAGHWLAESGLVPDRALVSSAIRTLQTWDLVSGAAGWGLAPVVEDGLFTASPDSALDLLRETPPEIDSLVMVGHNPTIAYLAQLLDDGNGDAEASAAMIGGYPTCALTVFTFEGDWADLDMGSASLAAFHTNAS